MSGSAKGDMHDNLVDSCIFTQPIVKGNINGGLTCIQMADALPGITTDTTNVVSNNQFLNLKAPEYSDLPYAQCCSCPVATNNQATGVDSLWFVEPGSSGPGQLSTFDKVTVQVTGNRLTDSGPIAPDPHAPQRRVWRQPKRAKQYRRHDANTVQTPGTEQAERLRGGYLPSRQFRGGKHHGARQHVHRSFTPGIRPHGRAGEPHLTELFHVASLSILNNAYVNFPTAGAENNVTTNAAYNPKFTNTGNKRQ